MWMYCVWCSANADAHAYQSEQLKRTTQLASYTFTRSVSHRTRLIITNILLSRTTTKIRDRTKPTEIMSVSFSCSLSVHFETFYEVAPHTLHSTRTSFNSQSALDEFKCRLLMLNYQIYPSCFICVFRLVCYILWAVWVHKNEWSVECQDAYIIGKRTQVNCLCSIYECLFVCIYIFSPLNISNYHKMYVRWNERTSEKRTFFVQTRW